MKIIFEVYLIFSLVFLAQQNGMAKFQVKSQIDSVEHEEHQGHEHAHTFLVTLKTVIFGSAEHEHEHEHEDEGLPWAGTHAHDNRTHNHHEIQSIKIELTNGKSIVSFLDSNKQIFLNMKHSCKCFDYIFEIFRPPITT